MASIIQLLAGGKKELLLGEVTARAGDRYTVNLKDRSVNIKSSISEILPIGVQVFVVNVENELRIIAKADIKTRQEKETVIING